MRGLKTGLSVQYSVSHSDSLLLSGDLGLGKTAVRHVKFNINTWRTGLLNCLNARSRGLTFRYRASCIQGQAFRCSPDNAFYIFNQQIYFII